MVVAPSLNNELNFLKLSNAFRHRLARLVSLISSIFGETHKNRQYHGESWVNVIGSF